MKNDKVIDILIGKANSANDLLNIVQGLVISQIICRRKLQEAFDNNDSSQNVVLSIMEEIVNTIDHLREQSEALNNEPINEEQS